MGIDEYNLKLDFLFLKDMLFGNFMLLFYRE